MSGKVVGWAFEHGHDLTSTQRFVLVAYADNADQNGKCWPDRPEIIEKTGLGKSSVYRAVTALKGADLMDEGEDQKGRHRIQLRVPWASHSGNPDSHTGNTRSHTGNRTTYREPSQETTSLNGSEAEWADWLDHYRSTTGRPAVGSASARAQFIARRAEGWTLDQLKTATVGCHADEWRREKGHDVPDTILRRSKVEGYYLAGLEVKPKSGLNLVRTAA